jgi:hypothetical protein
MKKKIILPVVFFSLLFAFKKINDVLADVGTTIQEVKLYTLEQIAKNDFDLPHYTGKIREACKKLPVGVREATMMNLGKVVKDWVQSPGFEAEYVAYLENNAGQRRGPAPMDEGRWAAERKKRTDQMIKALSNPDLVKVYAQTLDLQIETGQSKLEMLKNSPDLKLGQSKEEIQKELSDNKLLKELYQKDPEAFKTKYAEITVDKQLKGLMDNDKARTAQKQEKINALKDYKSIIAKQLRQFLTISTNVDYNAQTTVKNNKTVFVNPEYESKPLTWKLCFRSGKEAVTGARKFAQGWLDEMR